MHTVNPIDQPPLMVKGAKLKVDMDSMYVEDIGLENAKKTTLTIQERTGRVVETVTIPREVTIENFEDDEHDVLTFEATINKTELNKEYMVKLQGEVDGESYLAELPVFVGMGHSCGVGLFTRDERECVAANGISLQDEIRTAMAFAKDFARGFGVEFEFVARGRSTIQDVQTCFKHIAQNVTYEREWLEGFTTDSTVKTVGQDFTQQDYEAAFGRKDHAAQKTGTSFELVSPVLMGKHGLTSTLQVLAILRRLGIQASPSAGLHVHVSIGEGLGKGRGKLMSLRQVAGIWAAFAQYQFAIDEIMAPSRLGNECVQRHFVGSCSQNDKACDGAVRIFKQMHRFIREHAEEANNPAKTKSKVLEFCNAALRTPTSQTPCQEDHPPERNFMLNLAPLHRFGTIEFRSHGATTDVERVARWLHFVIAFVEFFGGRKEATKEFFDDADEDRDLADLAKSQRKAGTDSLFKLLTDAGLIDSTSKEYYARRSWEWDGNARAPGCNPDRISLSDVDVLGDCGAVGGSSLLSGWRTPEGHHVFLPAAST